jgi:hypothetical protein
MKKLVLIIAILTFSLGFSQTEKQSKIGIANGLIKSYNTSDFEELYSLFSKHYQEGKSLDDVISYFKRYQNAFGNIIKLNAAYNDKGFVKFPFQFEKENKTLVLKFNADNKLDYISINK